MVGHPALRDCRIAPDEGKEQPPMRTTTSNIPLEADHLEERMHNLKVDDALYDAIWHRVQAAREHFAKIKDADEAAARSWKQLDTLSTRLRAAKARMEKYLETDQFDIAKVRTIKDLALELADCAENLVRRIEAAAAHPENAPGTEMQLADLERIFGEADRLIP
jgi:hypothetical protein